MDCLKRKGREMSLQASELAERIDEFCKEYKLPKRHWGSLPLVANMTWALGAEMSLITRRMAHPADFGLECEILP
jgi:hypothetical protein